MLCLLHAQHQQTIVNSICAENEVRGTPDFYDSSIQLSFCTSVFIMLCFPYSLHYFPYKFLNVQSVLKIYFF